MEDLAPHDLETITDLQKLTDLFDRRGCSAVDIAGIMYRNFIDFFRKAWSRLAARGFGTCSHVPVDATRS